MEEKISNKNGNWFMVQIIERCTPVDNQQGEADAVYANFHLIKADNPAHAFDKASELGRQGAYTFTSTDAEMQWEFVGIGNLLPIYEDAIEDGAELIWDDLGEMSVEETTKLVFTKEEFLADIKPKRPTA